MIPTLLKQKFRQNQDFGKLASMLLDQCKEMLLTGAMPTNSQTQMDQSAPKAVNHLTIRHSQGFPSQFTIILTAY